MTRSSINYSDLNDSQLNAEERHWNEVLTHVNRAYYREAEPVSTADRDNALDALHEIRLEQWHRGYNVPTEEEREDYERDLARAEAKLNRIRQERHDADPKDRARLAKLEAEQYIAKNQIEECNDALEYIDTQADIRWNEEHLEEYRAASESGNRFPHCDIARYCQENGIEPPTDMDAASALFNRVYAERWASSTGNVSETWFGVLNDWRDGKIQ